MEVRERKKEDINLSELILKRIRDSFHQNRPINISHLKMLFKIHLALNRKQQKNGTSAAKGGGGEGRWWCGVVRRDERTRKRNECVRIHKERDKYTWRIIAKAYTITTFTESKKAAMVRLSEVDAEIFFFFSRIFACRESILKMIFKWLFGIQMAK